MSIPPPAPPLKIPASFKKDPETLAFFTSLLNSNYQKWSETRQGDFTPTIQDSSLSDAESQTYSAQTGSYYRIGDMVYFSGHVTMSSLGSLTTTETARLASFPFPAHNKADVLGGIHISLAGGLSITANASITGYIDPSSNCFVLQLWDATTGTSGLLLSELTSAGNFYFNGWYIAE